MMTRIPGQQVFLFALATLLLSLGTVAAQENEIVELARGNWSVEYEGNVMEVRGIERTAEYQCYFDNSIRPRGPRIVAPVGLELAIVYLRTERVSAKTGFASRQLILVSVDGRKFEASTVLIGGPYSRFDPAQQLYEVPIVVPLGTTFNQVVLYRQKYDPNRRESVVIDIPNGL